MGTHSLLLYREIMESLQLFKEVLSLQRFIAGVRSLASQRQANLIPYMCEPGKGTLPLRLFLHV